jgi:hypothetical protein
MNGATWALAIVERNKHTHIPEALENPPDLTLRVSRLPTNVWNGWITVGAIIIGVVSQRH